MQSFRDLKVWEKGHLLTLAVYKVTEKFPREEVYGLTSQMRRSASSVPANIAEGCCRDGDRDFARFLQTALSSASELEYHLLLGRDLGLLNTACYEDLESQTTEIKRMLTSFIRKLRTKT